LLSARKHFLSRPIDEIRMVNIVSMRTLDQY
jgi:hypothetical protein